MLVAVVFNVNGMVVIAVMVASTVLLNKKYYMEVKMRNCKVKVSVISLTLFALLNISMTGVNATPKCNGAAVSSCNITANSATCSNYYIKNSNSSGIQCQWNGKSCNDSGVQCNA